jgi:hypothetical protein
LIKGTPKNKLSNFWTSLRLPLPLLPAFIAMVYLLSLKAVADGWE